MMLLPLLYGAATVVSFAFAAVVFLTRPGRAQNRYLALLLMFIGFNVGSDLIQAVAPSPDDVMASGATEYVSFVFLILVAYPFFLSTIDVPVIGFLRPRTVRWSLVASAFGFSAFGLAGWAGNPLLTSVDALAVLVFSLSILVGVSAYRRASEPLARAQAMAYIMAFAVLDASVIAFMLLFGFFDGGGLSQTQQVWGEAILFPLPILWFVAWLSYGILKTQLFDIDLKIKWTIKQSTLAAAFVAVFFLVSEGAAEFLGERTGSAYWGIAATALLVFALAPLQRAAARVADLALPHVREDDPDYVRLRKADVYGAALAGALADGEVTMREREMLTRLQLELGVSNREAREMERGIGGGAP
ncbi:MAG: hypothetical protein KY455_05840 [Euryarchaeota archaeon]|nr:hypothetical protein [Euryarchaeota archaeon]